MEDPRCAPLLLLLLLPLLLTPPAGDAAVITGVSCPRTCRAWMAPETPGPGCVGTRKGVPRVAFSGIVLWPLGNMFYSQGRGQPAQDGIKWPQLLPSPPFPPALLPFGLLFYLVAQRSFFPSEKVIFQELEKTTPPNPAILTDT